MGLAGVSRRRSNQQCCVRPPQSRRQRHLASFACHPCCLSASCKCARLQMPKDRPFNCKPASAHVQGAANAIACACACPAAKELRCRCPARERLCDSRPGCLCLLRCGAQGRTAAWPHGRCVHRPRPPACPLTAACSTPQPRHLQAIKAIEDGELTASYYVGSQFAIDITAPSEVYCPKWDVASRTLVNDTERGLISELRTQPSPVWGAGRLPGLAGVSVRACPA